MIAAITGPVLFTGIIVVRPGFTGAKNTTSVKYAFGAIVKDRCTRALLPWFECMDAILELSSKFSSLINLYVGTPTILGMSLCLNPATILLIVLIFVIFLGGNIEDCH